MKLKELDDWYLENQISIDESGIVWATLIYEKKLKLFKTMTSSKRNYNGRNTFRFNGLNKCCIGKSGPTIHNPQTGAIKAYGCDCQDLT